MSRAHHESPGSRLLEVLLLNKLRSSGVTFLIIYIPHKEGKLIFWIP